LKSKNPKKIEKNKFMSRGLEFERKMSKLFHLKGVPVLFSSLLFREWGVSQIDFSYLVKKNDQVNLYIGECKTTPIIKGKQLKKLKKSCEICSTIFSSSVTLLLVSPNGKIYSMSN
jgi:hypothetical protein